MNPAVDIGNSALANPTPAELSQQARQRNGATQRDTTAAQAQPTDIAQSGRIAQAPASAAEATRVPAVRPADLTQQAQFALNNQNAESNGAGAARPEVVERLGPNPPGRDLTGALDTEVLMSDPDPLVSSDSGNAEDSFNRGDAAADLTPTVQAFDGLNTEQRAQLRDITETIAAVQGAAAATTDNPVANDNRTDNAPDTINANRTSGPVVESGAGQAAERAAEEDISSTGTTNDAAGPILPRGSTLSLVA